MVATTSRATSSFMISWGIGPPTTRWKRQIRAANGPICESVQHWTGTDGPLDERDIQVGDHNVTGSTLSETTLEECQRAADAEGGVFFCSKDGLAVFKNKDWLTTDIRSTAIQGYLGYEEVPAGVQAAHIDSDLQTSWELARVVNHAAYAREGGTAQEFEDAQSQSYYGLRSSKRTDLHNTSDGEVLALAVRVVNAQRSEASSRRDHYHRSRRSRQRQPERAFVEHGTGGPAVDPGVHAVRVGSGT